MGTYSTIADLYDLIYQGKDYRSESQQIGDLILKINPQCRRILDVACGTGAHHPFLAERFEVDGLDIEPALLDCARHRNPNGKYIQANMADFRLNTRYDAILCLFSSIAYVKSLDRIVSTLNCFRNHLENHGVALVEPWITPEKWTDGHVGTDVGKGDGVTVCRMLRTYRKGNLSFLQGEYLIGTASGIERRSDLHELGLFSVEEMKGAFAAAGLMSEYDPKGLIGRGMYIARPDAKESRGHR